MSRRLLSLFVAALVPLSALALPSLVDPQKEEREGKFYRIEPISIPNEVNLEVGGMGFMPDGALMLCTRRGEVWSFKKNKWKRFASGLDEPMGLCPINKHEIIVAQRCELTRLTDLDHDGVADRFECLTDAWNYSGQDYEWAFGPVRDTHGNFYGSLACWFFPTKHYDKKIYSGWELPPPAGYSPSTNTAWRGWCFKVTSRGEFIPFASGFRSPNGLTLDRRGELFITDNQGEYFGSDVLLHVTQNSFQGHPNALFWGPNATNDAFAAPLEELDKHRTLPAVIFPYKFMGQSASEPVFDTTRGKFGPFADQLFLGDQSHSTLMRVTLEKVGGEFQGACYPFRRGFRSGNNRAVFAKDGSLWVGETSRGWGSVGGSTFGLERVTWTGAMPFEILKMELTKNGFDLTFTKAVDRERAKDPRAYSFQRYYYKYHREYGSPQTDVSPLHVSSVSVSRNGKQVSLTLPGLMAGKIYELNLNDLKAADGTEPIHPTAYYTLNRLQSK